MKRFAMIGCCLGALAGGAQAETVTQRMITDDQAATWAAVGALNVAGNRACTATLISPTEVITAAHCLFHPVTHHRAEPGDIRFVAGLRRDAYVALRTATATAILPGYVYGGHKAGIGTVANDLALIRIAPPVTETGAMPVADWPADVLARVDVVGYGRDRPLIASIRAGCATLDHRGPVMLLDCAGVPGLSGSPVTLSGTAPQPLVAVVSAVVGTVIENDQMLVVQVAPHLATLRGLLGP